MKKSLFMNIFSGQYEIQKEINLGIKEKKYKLTLLN